jgi:hypothetical protein
MMPWLLGLPFFKPKPKVEHRYHVNAVVGRRPLRWRYRYTRILDERGRFSYHTIHASHA